MTLIRGLFSLIFLSPCLIMLSSIENSYNSKNAFFSLTTEYIPNPIYGVTLDSIDDIDSVITSLSKLPIKPTTRIVFDKNIPAIDYKKAVEEIHNVSYIVGGLLDSCAFSQYPVNAYKQRVEEYLNILGNKIDIWEIGNEINGEWLGNIKDVKNKIFEAYKLVKNRNQRVALTLYYNEECYSNPKNEMFLWTETQIPPKMKNGLDYVFISYYADDCPGSAPNWPQVFTRLHHIFPNARIGFGEVGTENKPEKANYMRQFYSLNINVPNYVGGYFWWYFRQDMVPHTKPLWIVLAKIMNEQKKTAGTPSSENYSNLTEGLKNAFGGIRRIKEAYSAANLLVAYENRPEEIKKQFIKPYHSPCGSDDTENFHNVDKSLLNEYFPESKY